MVNSLSNIVLLSYLFISFLRSLFFTPKVDDKHPIQPATEYLISFSSRDSCRP